MKIPFLSLWPKKLASDFKFLTTLSGAGNSSWLVFGVAIIEALLEVCGVLSVVPFIALVFDQERLLSNAFVSVFSEKFDLNRLDLMYLFCGIFLFFNIFLLFFRGVATKVVTEFSFRCGVKLSDLYLQDFLSINRGGNKISKSYMSSKLVYESSRVAIEFIYPFVRMISRGLIFLGLFLSLLFFLPFKVFAFVLLIVIGYFLFYRLIKTRMLKHSLRVIRGNHLKISHVNDLCDLSDEIKIRSANKYFIDRFIRLSDSVVRSESITVLLTHIPVLAVEFLLISALVATLLVLTLSGREPASFLPDLSLVVFAGYRSLPTVQQIYSSLASMKNVEEIVGQMKEFVLDDRDAENLYPENSTISKVDDVSFGYMSSLEGSLVTCQIDKGCSVSILGKSGIGKSTVLRKILGRNDTSKLQCNINGIPVESYDLRSVYKVISYLPQSVSVFPGTLKENILWGEKPDEVRLDDVLNASGLSEFVALRNNGVDCWLDEGGSNLSGGEIKRIGVARTLYKRADIYFFDEPTSALDVELEQQVMSGILDFCRNSMVVIITHSESVAKVTTKSIILY